MMDVRHITFFVDPAWRRSGQYSPLLYPFWGNPLTEQTPFQKALFDRHGYDTRLYRITDDPQVANMVLMPFSHNIARQHMPDLLAACVEKAAALGKPLLIDGVGDVEYPVDIPNVFVLRYGGYRFEKKPYEIHIPPYADDLLEVYCGGELQLRKKSEVPVVGFAGWGTLTLKQTVRSIIKELPHRLHGIVDSRYRTKKKGVFFRAEAIRVLESSSLVEAHIVRRTSYSGHAHTVVGDAETVRKEFVDNLLHSDYGLDVRGDANASTRLFEILALGRIPVLVDTERNLPFSQELDYTSFACIVDHKDLAVLPERIAAFHASLSEEQFQTMQRNARDAYVHFFRVDALMSHISAEITAKTDSLSTAA